MSTCGTNPGDFFMDFKVVVILETGDFVASNQMRSALYISVSCDGVIYVADMIAGAYQSTDESISWNLLLIPPENWLCQKVIKVTNGLEDDFWT